MGLPRANGFEKFGWVTYYFRETNFNDLLDIPYSIMSLKTETGKR